MKSLPISFTALVLVTLFTCSVAFALSSDAYPSVVDYSYANSAPNGHNGNNVVVYLPYIGETTLQKAILQNTSGPFRMSGNNIYYSNGLALGQAAAYARLQVNGSAFFGSDAGGLVAAAGTGVRIFYDSGNDAGQIYAYNYATTNPKSLVLQQPGGRVGIGTNTPGYTLDAPTGTINASVMQAGSFVYSSDARLKQDVTPLSEPQALNQVLALTPVTFKWKDAAIDARRHYGFIAQDVQTTLPYAVSTNANGYLAVEYGNLIAPLTAAVQAQQKIIESQQAQIDALRADVEALKSSRK